VVLGQKTRWRRDPGLVHAYSRADWAWFGQYVLRVLVYGVLWWTGQIVALEIARCTGLSTARYRLPLRDCAFARK
jgi:hypothetical protein